MENSILTSTKKILGIMESYTVFDLDIITHINAAFGVLNQIGLCPDGFSIEDDTAQWSDLELTDKQTGMMRSYIYLKVRSLFDPPSTSYLIDAMNKQIEEFEHRLSWAREENVPYPVVEEV